nr:immunoglobulin heavy chain junction region [Mus musculus]
CARMGLRPSSAMDYW